MSAGECVLNVNRNVSTDDATLNLVSRPAATVVSGQLFHFVSFHFVSLVKTREESESSSFFFSGSYMRSRVGQLNESSET